MYKNSMLGERIDNKYIKVTSTLNKITNLLSLDKIEECKNSIKTLSLVVESSPLGTYTLTGI